MKAIRILSIFALSLLTSAFAQGYVSTQSHEGRINELMPLETSSSFSSTFYSAGNDGFIVKWTKDGMGEHYQISDKQIRLIARNPSTGDVAVYESDGISVNRITVIDPKTYAKKFSKKFTDSISCLSYSAKGTHLFIGTNAVNGTYILNAKTGNVTKKISDCPGIVTMARTGQSETRAMLYLKSGSIVYYNLKTLKTERKISTQSNLDQPMVFGKGNFNNRFLAGIRDNYLYIIDSMNGKTLASYPATGGLIFSSEFESGEKQGLYFITENGKTFTLKMIDSDMMKKMVAENAQPAPLIVKNFTGLRSRDKFTCGAKNSGTIILGTQSGNIYTMTDIPESEMYSLFAITENMYQKIYDIEAGGKNFYCLTANSIFQTSYDTKVMNRIGTNPGQTNIMKFGDQLLLWSKNKAKAVQTLETDGSDSLTTLFTPSNQIRSLRIAGNKIVYVLGTSSVNIFNIESRKNYEVYSGTSLQDAVLINDNTIYVSKTATGRGDSPLISVNIQTGETVPLKFPGDVAFSLSYDYGKENSYVYGISISSDENSSRTEVFSYNPKNGSRTMLLNLQSEDSDAFTSIKLPLVYTNIGKNQIRSCNTLSNKTTVYRRSASMPLKVASSSDRLAVLNYNGSISWYSPVSQAVLADWYLTAEGEWFEF